MTREMFDLEDVLVTDSPIAMGKDKQRKDALAQSRAPDSSTAFRVSFSPARTTSEQT